MRDALLDRKLVVGATIGFRLVRYREVALDNSQRVLNREHWGWRTFQVSEFWAVDGQTAPYCLLLRPESPYGRGARFGN
jgi:hypothetical protein